ncbi:PREDICTED: probable palmitoyltransferase ZDHHC1 isoform X3 [Galeopterus variegatus]|uniref:Probable palmitoyltransferase ZDHHC1 isoform X3 n=1 Tax=Galeopterus variegatus TaxID=482537 RepID=A0ABM0QC08_GALVR|nr:PREDICTED: probable palmitoyltransferase ZDHHC1 isoform X3 [Galeopterus variegatus]
MAGKKGPQNGDVRESNAGRGSGSLALSCSLARTRIFSWLASGVPQLFGGAASPRVPLRSASRGRARSSSPRTAVGWRRLVGNAVSGQRSGPSTDPNPLSRAGQAGPGQEELNEPAGAVCPLHPQELSLQALQRLQQVRVRLRPSLQVAQQLRGREELPLRTNQHFEVLKNHTDMWFVFLPAAPVETQAPAILALAALLILLGLLSTALLGHLLCFHIYLMWHKLTTYEYIVQHRPPQEAKGAHRELESCPPKMRPIQEMEFYMRTFSHVRPEPPDQARPPAVNANPSRFLATSGQGEPPPPSSPDTLALPFQIRPQKKRKRRVYKVPTSGTLDRASSLSKLRGPRAPGSCSSSSTDSVGTSPMHAAGASGAYQSASAESMDEIPVAQKRLGSAALAAPGVRDREPGLAPQTRAPAVFVSRSSGEPGALGGWEAGLA